MRYALLSLMLVATCSPKDGADPSPNAPEAPAHGARAPDGGMSVSFPAGLGVVGDHVIHASIHHPDGGPSSRVVVLAHQLCRDRSEWSQPEHNWVAALTKRQISVLAIDLRGHGESTTFVDGEARDLCKPKDDDVSQGQPRYMPNDIQGAVVYAQNALEATAIGLVGSSIGANAALSTLVYQQENVRIVVALSPGEDYRGVSSAGATGPLRRERHVVLLAAEDDERSADAVRKLEIQDGQCTKPTQPGKPAELVSCGAGFEAKIHETGGHGNDILKAHPKELERLVAILDEALK